METQQEPPPGAHLKNWWLHRLQSRVVSGARSELVASLFDIPPLKACQTWIGCEKGWEDNWTTTPTQSGAKTPWLVGMITGESGAGKTTLANHAWPGAINANCLDWPADCALAELFPPELTVHQVTRLLSGVGLASPPVWLRAAGALSTGQRFRAQTARLIALALTQPGQTLVMDEFATGIDLETARATSVGVARLARQLKIPLVAVTARHELTDWLDPDWVARPTVLESPTQIPSQTTFCRRLLRGRPPICLRLGRCHRAHWLLFRSHHYLNTSLAPSAICLGAWLTAVAGQPVSQTLVGFSAWVKALNKPGYREHRTVVLPPWQGMGVGQALANWSASLLAGLGQPVWSTTGHPALVAARLRSTQWRQTRPMGLVHAEVGKTHATCRLTAGFRFQGQPMQAKRARAILGRKPKCQTTSPLQA